MPALNIGDIIEVFQSLGNISLSRRSLKNLERITGKLRIVFIRLFGKLSVPRELEFRSFLIYISKVLGAKFTVDKKVLEAVPNSGRGYVSTK
jgi:hypothetical protein